MATLVLPRAKPIYDFFGKVLMSDEQVDVIHTC